MMISKEEQVLDKIYTDEELERFSQEMYENNSPLIVDSPFGKQYFSFLQKRQNSKRTKPIGHVETTL